MDLMQMLKKAGCHCVFQIVTVVNCFINQISDLP